MPCEHSARRRFIGRNASAQQPASATTGGRQSMSFKLVSVCFGLLAIVLRPAGGADFEVTSTQDAGVGSLRQAILDANDNQGADRIVFNIPGSGVQTIRPLSPLPVITEGLVLDGYTRPGTSVNKHSNADNAILPIQL